MDMGRRELLAGVAGLGVSTAVESRFAIAIGSQDAAPSGARWHPLTRSLLDRAGRACRWPDRPRVERIIRELAGERDRPMIKWMDDPDRAHQHLRRYPLSELAQMPTAQFWPFPPMVSATSDDAAERSTELYLHAVKVLRAEEHGLALMAPKLKLKARASALRLCPEAVFEARAVAAEIGWIETSLPGAAASAIRAVDDLFSAGHAESSIEIYHQLVVFEAFERGLLATWETPEELICAPNCSDQVALYALLRVEYLRLEYIKKNLARLIARHPARSMPLVK